VQRDVEAVLSNQCFSEKSVSITISECVSVALGMRQENRILSSSYYIVICGLPGCTVFSTFFRKRHDVRGKKLFNTLKPELNPICYLLALLAHHFLHVSRIRVKSLTIRLLMSYTYGAPILDVSRSHTTTQHSR